MARYISNGTKNKIEMVRKNLLDIIDVLDRILSGHMSQAEAAEEMGITTQDFNRQIQNGFTPYIRRKKIIFEEDILSILREIETPYEAFIKDVIGVPATVNKIYLIESKAEERFREECQRALSPQELEVIKLRYGFSEEETPVNRKTLEEIAEILGISRERVRQIIVKSWRKARHPSRLKKLLANYDEYFAAIEEESTVKRLYERTMEEYRAARASIRWFRAQVEFGKCFQETASNVYISDIPEFNREWAGVLNKNGIKTVYDLASCLKKNPELQDQAPFNNLFFKNICQFVGIDAWESDVSKYIEEIPLEAAEFSVRSYNALKRNGIATINQLIGMKEGELKKIRNLGQKSIDEIMKFISEQKCVY